MYDKIKCVEIASVRVTQLQAIHNLFAKASLYWNPKLKKNIRHYMSVMDLRTGTYVGLYSYL